MATVTVAYGENVIHESDESFTMNTEGTYLDEDISVIVESLPNADGVSF
jgi:hypothetical protein